MVIERCQRHRRVGRRDSNSKNKGKSNNVKAELGVTAAEQI
jgi:hypothetical protein